MPCNIGQLHSFLGLYIFFKQLVQRYFIIDTLLINLIQHDVKYN